MSGGRRGAREGGARHRSGAGILAAVFAVAVAINYPWELAQSPLYVQPGGAGVRLVHCGVASLGDGVLVLLIVAAGRLVLRRRDWFLRPGIRGYLVMLVTGLLVSVGVEWAALHVLGWWAYAPRMPLVPGLAVGITPVAQMLLLPPLIARIVAAWYERTGAASSTATSRGGSCRGHRAAA